MYDDVRSLAAASRSQGKQLEQDAQAWSRRATDWLGEEAARTDDGRTRRAVAHPELERAVHEALLLDWGAHTRGRSYLQRVRRLMSRNRWRQGLRRLCA